ncbi:hypothetical protein [Ferruginivarius sediminum]|nr:hypothetical protein [Ferruginivarius sediminum]
MSEQSNRPNAAADQRNPLYRHVCEFEEPLVTLDGAVAALMEVYQREPRSRHAEAVQYLLNDIEETTAVLRSKFNELHEASSGTGEA